MPTKGPERQEVINERPECLPKDQNVKEVINKGQSAYQRTRASRSYQQRPECLPKDQNVKRLLAKTRSAKLKQATNERHDGNHTRLGRSYTMVVPMNISSHREVGNPAEKREGRTRPSSEQERTQEANHKTIYNKMITTPNAR